MKYSNISRLLTLPEVSLITGISYVTILKHAKFGDLKASIKYKRLYVSREQLFDYVYKQWGRGRCLMYSPRSIYRKYKYDIERSTKFK